MVEQQEEMEKQEEKAKSESPEGPRQESIKISREDFVKAQKERDEESEDEDTPENGNETTSSGDNPSPSNSGSSDTASDGQPKKRGKGRPKRKVDVKLKIPELEKDEAESYKDLMITELKFRGIFDAVSNTEDRVMAKVFRLSQDQRNQLQGIRKDLYSTFRKLKSFKVDKKYVIPKNRLPDLEQEFQDRKKDFDALRIVIFRNLRQDWNQIVRDLKQKYPDLPIDFKEVGGMIPEDTDFLTMDYTIRSLENWLGEMDGLKKSFAKGNVAEEEIARRIDRQKDRIIESVRAQYEEKLTDLNNTVASLKKAVKNSAKLERIEKLKSKADKDVDDISSMAKLLGEEDAFKVNLDALQEMLTEDLLGEDPSELQFITGDSN